MKLAEANSLSKDFGAAALAELKSPDNNEFRELVLLVRKLVESYLQGCIESERETHILHRNT